MSEGKETIVVTTSENSATVYATTLEVPQPQTHMQAAGPNQQAIVPQASSQVAPSCRYVVPQVQQSLSQAGMAQVMPQGPQTAHSPHGVATSLPPQSPQYYVQASVATAMQAMQAPPAIAPAPGPQATTTTVSALHQPLQHHLAHPGVSPSQMQQFSPQVQVIQSGIPGGPYLQQVYQNAQGQLIMPIQSAAGMNAGHLQQGTLNPLNSSIQVITAAGKPFQGQIAPHMLAGGKAGMIQQSQTGYAPVTNQTSGGQTVLISQLGGQLGVISSQPHNILPAHSTGPKPGDMHKVNSMQAATFGPVQQGIAWATPGTLHSPTLLTTQNQPIFIRGAQPGQENVFIQTAQAQTMIPPNSMVPSIAAMPGVTQQVKPRSGMEMQANIQPKAPTMRPPILPSVTTATIRPGSTVSTQTAVGQQIAHFGTPRSQGKVRGKNAGSRSPAAVGAQQQMNHMGMGQIMQPGATIAVSGTSIGTSILPVTTQTITAGTMAKQAMEVVASPNMAQNKPSAPIHPANAPLMSGVRMAKGSQSPMLSSSQPIAVPSNLMTTVVAPASMPVLTASAERPNTVPLMSSAGVMPAVSSPSFSGGGDSLAETGKTGIPSQGHRFSPLTNGKPETPIDSKFPVSAPPLTTSSSQNQSFSSSTTEGGHGVVNGSLSAAEKNALNTNGPPKAMVKPHVMTHVIEGFVIHEASEPFPVNRSSLLSDLNKVRNQSANNTATVLPQGSATAQSEDDKECSKCEVCGKIDLRSKFKKSKRFCSSSCAKRFNVGLSKRVGPFKTDETSPKRFRDEMSPEGVGINENNHTSEEMQVMSEDRIKTPRVDILKWTVKDVVEFIHNLPGCQDYAEDFELQEIDGQALMLLKADHLMSAMNLKLGPALKICNQIENMRGDKKET